MGIKDETLKAIELYDQTFGQDTFPTIPLLMDIGDEETIKIINECVEKNKDVYELGYLSLDVIY